MSQLGEPAEGDGVERSYLGHETVERHGNLHRLPIGCLAERQCPIESHIGWPRGQLRWRRRDALRPRGHLHWETWEIWSLHVEHETCHPPDKRHLTH